MDSQIIRFWDLTDQFLLLPSLPAKIWKQVLGHMVSLEWFVPWSCSRMHPLQSQLKACWSPAADDLMVPVSVTEE